MTADMENKKQSFVATLRKSIYSPEFYGALPSKPFSASIKYFFMLALLLAFISAAAFGARVAPTIGSSLQKLRPALVKQWPEKLEITIKNGLVTTNVDEPYTVEFPQELKPSLQKAQGLEGTDHFLVIDTAHPFDLQKFYSLKTFFLLTKDSLVSGTEKSGVRIQSLAKFPDMKLNKTSIDAFFVEYIEPYIKFAAPLLTLGTFFLSFAVQALHLVYLFLGALLVWLVMRIKKISAGYRAAYRLSLHLVTIPKLASVFLSAFLSVHIPFLFTALLIITAWFNLQAGQTTIVPVESSENPKPDENRA